MIIINIFLNELFLVRKIHHMFTVQPMMQYYFFNYLQDYTDNCINHMIVKHLFMIINFNNSNFGFYIFKKNSFFTAFSF